LYRRSFNVYNVVKICGDANDHLKIFEFLFAEQQSPPNQESSPNKNTMQPNAALCAGDFYLRTGVQSERISSMK